MKLWIFSVQKTKNIFIRIWIFVHILGMNIPKRLRKNLRRFIAMYGIRFGEDFPNRPDLVYINIYIYIYIYVRNSLIYIYYYYIICILDNIYSLINLQNWSDKNIFMYINIFFLFFMLEETNIRCSWDWCLSV